MSSRWTFAAALAFATAAFVLVYSHRRSMLSALALNPSPTATAQTRLQTHHYRHRVKAGTHRRHVGHHPNRTEPTNTTGTATIPNHSPMLISASPVPSTVAAGATIRINYQIDNFSTQTGTLLFGAALAAPTGAAVRVASADVPITSTPGTGLYYRYLAIPSTTPAGTYTLVASLAAPGSIGRTSLATIRVAGAVHVTAP